MRDSIRERNTRPAPVATPSETSQSSSISRALPSIVDGSRDTAKRARLRLLAPKSKACRSQASTCSEFRRPPPAKQAQTLPTLQRLLKPTPPAHDRLSESAP